MVLSFFKVPFPVAEVQKAGFRVWDNGADGGACRAKAGFQGFGVLGLIRAFACGGCVGVLLLGVLGRSVTT